MQVYVHTINSYLLQVNNQTSHMLYTCIDCKSSFIMKINLPINCCFNFSLFFSVIFWTTFLVSLSKFLFQNIVKITKIVIYSKIWPSQNIKTIHEKDVSADQSHYPRPVVLFRDYLPFKKKYCPLSNNLTLISLPTKM